MIDPSLAAAACLPQLQAGASHASAPSRAHEKPRMHATPCGKRERAREIYIESHRGSQKQSTYARSNTTMGTRQINALHHRRTYTKVPKPYLISHTTTTMHLQIARRQHIYRVYNICVYTVILHSHPWQKLCTLSQQLSW
jgi:hypothetical protein